jgi:hypothetical protein
VVSVKGARIYLREDPNYLVVGCDERHVVDTLMELSDDKFVGFPAHPHGRTAFVLVGEIVAITPTVISDDE